MFMQTVGNAVAEPTPSDADPAPSRMLPGDCAAFVATPDGDVPDAWHLGRLQMDAVWRIATGDGITVAVIDTGVSTAPTPFFPRDNGRNKVTAFDYLDGLSEEDPDSTGMDCAHGTEVASLIAAARPDGKQVDPRTNFAGIAPDASIISYRVLSMSSVPDGQEGDPLGPTIDAVRDATEHEQVNVINLSQSVSRYDPLFEDFRTAVQEALDKGIVVVAAAGNVVPGSPPGEPSYPGAFDGVIAVGGTTATDAVSETSQPGEHISVGAPGANITTLMPSKVHQMPAHTNQAYAEGLTGTSFAAPIVSGVVALMLEQNPSLTPTQVKEILEATADPPPSAVPDSRIGFGIVNPTLALAGSPRPTERNPTADDVAVPIKPPPVAEDPDMTPAVVAVSVGAGALALVSVGLVAAISIPAAVRRNKRQAATSPSAPE